MAIIRLREWETDAEHLPMVCMVCGEPATTHVRRKFTWAPEWLSILAFLVCVVGQILSVIIVVLYFALRKQMLVAAPTCDRHKNYWRRRAIWAFVPLTLLFIVSVAEAVYIASLDQNDRPMMYLPCAIGGFGFFFWLIVAAVIQKETVQATLITERDITLRKVHDNFDLALKALRRAERDKANELDKEEPTARPEDPDDDDRDDRTSFRPK
jgi:hypothetical protein